MAHLVFMFDFQNATDRVQTFLDTGAAHTQASLDYFHSDPGILGRARLITVCGLGGIVLAFRGELKVDIFLQ